MADAPLINLTITNPAATEGIGTGTFTVATFTDGRSASPLTDFTATVTWGDGGTTTLTSTDGSIVSEGGGSFALLARHTYAEERQPHTLSVQVLDVGGSASAAAVTLTVADAP